MKKIISFILTLCIAVCASASAFAFEESNFNDNNIELYYLYTGSVHSTLSISSKTATCHSSVQGFSDKVTKITITQELQVKDGSKWVSKYGMGKTVYASSTSFVKTYSNLDSGSYRVKTIAKVYSGTSYETVTAYSKAVSC